MFIEDTVACLRKLRQKRDCKDYRQLELWVFQSCTVPFNYNFILNYLSIIKIYNRL